VEADDSQTAIYTQLNRMIKQEKGKCAKEQGEIGGKGKKSDYQHL